MKTVSIYLLSFMVFLASFQSSLVNIDYCINQDFYEAHCTNKDKPEMNCHGKCQVRSHSEKDAGILKVAKFCYEFNFVPQPTISFSENQENIEWRKDSAFPQTQDQILKGFEKAIPHPPEI